jgi:hypothetical protein
VTSNDIDEFKLTGDAAPAKVLIQIEVMVGGVRPIPDGGGRQQNGRIGGKCPCRYVTSGSDVGLDHLILRKYYASTLNEYIGI